MRDIVERLNAVAAMDLRTGSFVAHTLDTAAIAAAEIERLRAERDKLRAALSDALALAGVWDDNHPVKRRARAALAQTEGRP